MRRVTGLIGPFGSGKSELALGLSLHLAAQLAAARRLALPTQPASGLETPAGAPVSPVVVVDLDVLKPYFRSREVGDRMSAEGVALLAPRADLANTDLPIISPEMRGAVSRPDAHVVLDVGGDPVGARALGSMSDVVGGADYDLLLVLNRYRPFMDAAEMVVAHARQIVAASRLSLTGVISNTHLLDETQVDDVGWGLELARAVAAELGVPVRLLAVPAHLVTEARALAPDLPAVAIRRRMLPEFLGGVVLAAPRPPARKGQEP